MSTNPDAPKPDDEGRDTGRPIAAPVAEPPPPLDGPKPIPAGDGEVEKFLVATDTGGGD